MKNPNPMSYCIHYETCSAPVCPLDPNQAKRHRETGDPTCDVSKHYRSRSWREMPSDWQALLPRQGLTLKEWNARIREATMSPEDKATRAANFEARVRARLGASSIPGKANEATPAQESILENPHD